MDLFKYMQTMGILYILLVSWVYFQYKHVKEMLNEFVYGVIVL